MIIIISVPLVVRRPCNGVCRVLLRYTNCLINNNNNNNNNNIIIIIIIIIILFFSARQHKACWLKTIN